MAERFEVVFLGTGSPLPSPDRCGAGHVVVAGDQHVLVDCGWSAARHMGEVEHGRALVGLEGLTS